MSERAAFSWRIDTFSIDIKGDPARHWPTKPWRRGSRAGIAEMQDRLERLQDCAAKRRQIAK
ncbi:MAG: hypothetical protein WBE29_16130, partial [Pseudolabrys sp.]